MCLIHEKSWEHIVQKCDFSPQTANVLCVYTRQSLLQEYKEYRKLEKMVSGYHLNKAFIYFMLLFHSRLRESSSTSSTSSTTDSSLYLMPYFEFFVQRNVTVTLGQTAFMNCIVQRLGDKDVSWIRKRDLHILTAGTSSYTSDQRFQVIKTDSGNWTLQIKYPQLRDSGVYECQINTEPKMSLSYTLNVLELRAEILGPADLFVKSGSQIILTCRLYQGPHDLGSIFWYKGDSIIDTTIHENLIQSDDAHRINIDTDWTDGLTSRLRIQRATSTDTANYTCVATIAKSSSVYVNVIKGEHPAAMQHNSGRSLSLGLISAMVTIINSISRTCNGFGMMYSLFS